MNADDPLSALRDIHLPPPLDPVSIWPLVLFALAVVAALFAGAILLARLRRGWLRELRAQLALIDAADGAALTDMATLLRRAAIAQFGASVARLQGDAWLATLDRLFRTTFFTKGAGLAFGPALYAESGSPHAPAILDRVKRLAARREWLPW